jgi:hypothetical protein
MAFVVIQILGDRADGVLVAFRARHFQQLADIVQSLEQLFQRIDDFFQLSTLLAQRLGAFGIVPDIGLFQLALDLGQTFAFVFEVKDTP